MFIQITSSYVLKYFIILHIYVLSSFPNSIRQGRSFRGCGFESQSNKQNKPVVQTRQFTVRIERIGEDTPHITLTNCHGNGNSDIYVDSEEEESKDTDAILYANDQKNVATQAKLLS